MNDDAHISRDPDHSLSVKLSLCLLAIVAARLDNGYVLCIYDHEELMN